MSYDIGLDLQLYTATDYLRQGRSFLIPCTTADFYGSHMMCYSYTCPELLSATMEEESQTSSDGQQVDSGQPGQLTIDNDVQPCGVRPETYFDEKIHIPETEYVSNYYLFRRLENIVKYTTLTCFVLCTLQMLVKISFIVCICIMVLCHKDKLRYKIKLFGI